MSQPPPIDPDASCDSCGRFGAFRFDGETLCAECYAGRGSCCSAEFSGRPCDETVETPSPAQTTPEENLRLPPGSSR